VASVYARHSRRCSFRGRWSRPDALNGCTCSPVFTVRLWKQNRLLCIPVGHDLTQAKREAVRLEAAKQADRQLRRQRESGLRGATVATAYSRLRLLIQDVDRLIPDAQDWAKPNLKVALSQLYGAEDALTRALREGGV
jgi:hypothetical protein